MSGPLRRVAETLADRLEARAPRVLLTLGSGLGALADEVDAPLVVDFAEVGLPPATVPGHAGRLVIGRLGGVEVIIQQGRLHLYEGVGARAVAACVRAAAEIGVGTFVVTNAAGGLRITQAPGDLVVLRDHLNLTGTSPLVPDRAAGPDARTASWPSSAAPAAGPARPAFVDMSAAYDGQLRAAARQTAAALGERLVEGVYAGLVGPAYETPAEVAMLRTLGADVVGMSTVTEVIAARAAGLRVLGLSLVTNVHGAELAGSGVPTDHAEVLDVAAEAGPRLAALVRALLPRLASRPGESTASWSSSAAPAAGPGGDLPLR